MWPFKRKHRNTTVAGQVVKITTKSSIGNVSTSVVIRGSVKGWTINTTAGTVKAIRNASFGRGGFGTGTFGN